MKGIFNKLIGDKKRWNELEARAQELPRDFKIVYDEIKEYMWNLWRFKSEVDLNDFSILDDLITLFEQSAADGKKVLEVTGNDVAAFCDELFNATESWKKYLNEKIQAKLKNA